MSMLKLNDFAAFKKVLECSKNIIVLTGAGISAESGIPVFRGPGGLWRTHKSTELASLGAFRRNPSIVWEFYHYRRTVAFNAQPNRAHMALAIFEQECQDKRGFHIITQNVDGLHARAGSKNLIELHGALNKVRCLNAECQAVEENNDNPICEALRGRGDPAAKDGELPDIDIAELPKCKHCSSLVRPHIAWFGESLNEGQLAKCRELVDACDLCLVIGTSMMVYPAAELAPMVADAGKPVAEFNVNEWPSRDNFQFHFCGPSSVTVPIALGYDYL